MRATKNGCTADILDALKRHNAPACFFVVGNYIDTAPELVQRMVSEGHIVGNHTLHHPDMSSITDKDAFAVEPCRPEQCQGNPRRLARAGRRFKYTSGPAAQCFKQIREQGLNGQDFCGMIEHAPL